ncbi:LysR family transcriptional regulator [Variovorax sp. IB41]|uniref:LysR family transcriptional regulator n=1 Tax=Variovorax sp. IB41 TaxID=2779370 RepID=UPI001E3DFF05|nr:LysR family transcriptional regulator [Variovorax sp. IB41]
MAAFVRVVESGSFTKAAKTLNVPKPTVTRLVQALESQLNAQLLHRSTRAVTLTAEGATYYERTVRLLAELEDIEAGTRSSLARPSGKIKVELSVAMAAMLVVPALTDFYARYPDIEIELSVSNRDVDIIADNVDCAIRTGPIADQSLVARRIGYLHFTTCASPSYLERRGVPTHPDELSKGHDTIGMVSSRTARPLPFVYHKDSVRLEVTPQYRLSINDTHAYLAAGVAGLGIVQAASIAVQDAIESGQLVPLLEDWQSDVYATSIVYPPNRFLSAKVRVFVDWAVDLFEHNKTVKRKS